MKVRNILRPVLLWLISGLGLSIVQPTLGQTYTTNTGPLFEFAAFYNGLMEFTDCSPLVINGPVFCNSNIYVGCPSSGSTLTFNGYVTAWGVLTNPAWFGYAQESYIASNITFNGTPAPGWTSGWPNVPAITLPFGNLTNAYQLMIQLPNSSDSPTNPATLQRYFYKADLVILVTNFTSVIAGTNV